MDLDEIVQDDRAGRLVEEDDLLDEPVAREEGEKEWDLKSDNIYGNHFFNLPLPQPYVQEPIIYTF
jgi:hypothetical protein